MECLKFLLCVLAIAFLIVVGWKLFFVSERPSEPEEVIELSAFPLSIVVDAGHGGMDGGTVGNGLVERALTLPIALKVESELKSRGYAVVMTRREDEALSLDERSALANSGDTLVFVSIHGNAGPEGVHGAETFYSSPKVLPAEVAARAEFRVPSGAIFEDRRGQLLAEAVQEAVCAATGAKDRGAKNRPGLAVTRHTHAPAILVETGFLSHPGEAKRLGDPAYQQKIASGIADGIAAYLAAGETDPYYGVTIVAEGTDGEG